MKTLFLDTNIVVDLLEKREPFCQDAVQIFTMAYNKQVRLIVSPMTFLLPHFSSANTARRVCGICWQICVNYVALPLLMKILLMIRWHHNLRILKTRCNIILH